MRILILGGMGMLGHRMWIELAPAYETWVTARVTNPSTDWMPDPSRLVRVVDATDQPTINGLLDQLRPDVIINCVGLVKQHKLASDPISAIRLNSLLPHQLLSQAAGSGARLIHVSTDCVFSGARGAYVESDTPDPTDLYGRSKLLGEIGDPGLTIRTSIVGRELGSRHGLLEWFLGEAGPVAGYTRSIFSGLTTIALARLFRDTVIPRSDLRGLYHVASEPISKYELLRLFRSAYKRQIEINADDSLIIDRSLDPSRFLDETQTQRLEWERMVAEMALDPDRYEPVA
jgi:dTDP-4-dehydrorhamnose reductase